jgi:hypothetical protein
MTKKTLNPHKKSLENSFFVWEKKIYELEQKGFSPKKILGVLKEYAKKEKLRVCEDLEDDLQDFEREFRFKYSDPDFKEVKK